MRSARGLIAGLALALTLPGAAAAETEGPVVLDPAAREALAALPALRGAAPKEADLAGRIVIVSFFASWCPPCHPEFDHLKAIHARYAGAGVTVVAVNIFETFGRDDGGLRLDRFLAGKDPAFPVLGGGETVAGVFGSVKRIPTVFVFGRGGQPVLHFIHEQGATKTHVGYEELEGAVRAALQPVG